MSSLFAEMLGLVLPQECVGCGVWDTSCCPDCLGLLDGAPYRCEEGAAALAGVAGGAARLPVWAVAPYAGAVRRIVVAWKRGLHADLARAVERAGRRAGAQWWAELAPAGLPGAGICVLPAPSGWRRRAAGRFVVGALARAVAAGLEEAGAGPPVLVADALRRGVGRAHQAGLGAGERAVNRRTGTRLARPLPVGAPCLLVDDVLTTGATLAAARGALVARGHRVVAALVVAATPAPRRRR